MNTEMGILYKFHMWQNIFFIDFFQFLFFYDFSCGTGVWTQSLIDFFQLKKFKPRS
jgi:hypothetical protein